MSSSTASDAGGPKGWVGREDGVHWSGSAQRRAMKVQALTWLLAGWGGAQGAVVDLVNLAHRAPLSRWRGAAEDRRVCCSGDAVVEVMARCTAGYNLGSAIELAAFREAGPTRA